MRTVHIIKKVARTIPIFLLYNHLKIVRQRARDTRLMFKTRSKHSLRHNLEMNMKDSGSSEVKMSS